MRMSPRYVGPTILTLAGEGDVGELFVRQRRRLDATFRVAQRRRLARTNSLRELDGEDVATHLDSVNGFFHSSIAAGLAGTPTAGARRFRSEGDASGDGRRRASRLAKLSLSFLESDDALCKRVSGLDDGGGRRSRRVHRGLVPIRLLVHHALWDSWVHGRDVGLPLGLAVAEEPDEILACLRYVAGFGPAVALMLGKAKPAVLVLEATDPDGCVIVEVTDRVAVHDQPPRMPPWSCATRR